MNEHEPMTTKDIVKAIIAGALFAVIGYPLLVFWLAWAAA